VSTYSHTITDIASFQKHICRIKNFPLLQKGWAVFYYEILNFPLASKWCSLKGMMQHREFDIC